MDFSFSFSRRKALYIFCLGLLITAVYILSTVRGAFLTFDLASVNAMPFLVAAVGFYRGGYASALAGVYAGVLMSLSSATPEGAEALVLGLFGAFCGFLAVNYMRRVLPSVLACGSGLLALRGVISATYYWIFYSVPFFTVLASYLRIIAVSLVPGALCYFAVGWLERRLCGEDF